MTCGAHHLQTFLHNKLINNLLLMQFYLINICPKLHHQKWRTLRVILPETCRVDCSELSQLCHKCCSSSNLFPKTLLLINCWAL